MRAAAAHGHSHGIGNGATNGRDRGRLSDDPERMVSGMEY
jgi:hypothetical protein